jgi:hypothetical protein
VRRLVWAFVIGWILGRAFGLAEAAADLRREMELRAPIWDRWST